ETTEGLTGTVEYNTDLFDVQTIQRMAQHFLHILEGVVNDPAQSIVCLPILGRTERAQILVNWNSAEQRFPDGQCVHHFFEQQATVTPDAVAAVVGNRSLTYAELNRRANGLAHNLQGLGAGPDVPIGICLERSLEMLIGLLAILKTGGAYVPLDPAYPRERLTYMLADSKMPVLVTQASLANTLPTGEHRVVMLDEEWQDTPADFTENVQSDVSPDNLAYVIYTSGSTGMPKGVAMPHRPLCNLISWQSGAIRLGGRCRVLQFAPISFDVSFQELFSTWASGGTIVLIQDDTRLDPTQLLKVLAEQDIARVFLPCVALRQLAEAAAHGADSMLHLKEVITAGEQLQITQAIADFFRLLPDCRLHNHYGPTEAHVVTSHTLGPSPAGWPVLPPIGRPISNTTIYILDPNLQPVPINVAGELYIGGAALARGYLNRPELTAERFIPDPFGDPGSRLYRTGDLARYLPDGAIHFLGRTDHQVKIRGFRVELGEVEALLATHTAVRACAVAVREDASGSKHLIAYIVPADTHLPPTLEDLRGFLTARLPGHMIPAAFVLVPAMPLTPSGKVNRKALPARDAGRLHTRREFTAPRNLVEDLLASIWQQVLGLERVG
ncbi:MAG TPA: amino acid adenylation domain-containing protein, partial [Phycisphaerae bacterium]|nr:amino acid adenylation domain-containing protein [Phycisphaerae bacterium]